MNTKEMREKSALDLKKAEEKLRLELATVRMQLKVQQLADTSKVKTLRKELARMLTVRQMALTSSKIS